MKKQILNEGWTMTVHGENVFGIPEIPLPAKVPGSVYSTLLDQGKMPDPFYRDNELNALKLMENDFTFRDVFVPERGMLSADTLLLHFGGIDTLAEISLNGNRIGCAFNMHRAWDYDIRRFVKEGENELAVTLRSPLKYIREENETCFTGGSEESCAGFPHLRKAHCMFGWDWGPRLPDAGIFGEVALLAVKEARIDTVRIRQNHAVTGRTVRGNEVERVDLNFVVSLKVCTPGKTDSEMVSSEHSAADFKIELTVTTPEGRILTAEKNDCIFRKTSAEIYSLVVDHPRLWWPNGYGQQDLYTVTCRLFNPDTKVLLDTWERRIGLRTLTVNQDAKPQPETEERSGDERNGRNFAFEVNGLQIFAMGSDYIPEDSLITRQSGERSEKLLRDAAKAHQNCLRIWGGGYYKEDYFYDLCDELGLIVWQDFMFACAVYELTDDFDRNIREEFRQQIRRLRDHACLGLWCGNNEDESLLDIFHPTMKQRGDYIKMYEYILPQVLKEEDPDHFYWPSSPSSGGSFDNPNAENIGDTHYWGVWHGNEPFTAYRSHHFRFLSEFGFQSFPCLPTVKSFTEEQDRNIFSRVMEMHQRNSSANGKILYYLSQTYLYPKDFRSLLYASQLLQADAIRYGVEHFRRIRGICMGTVVWQLNDIWPAPSWSSIDYFGRRKALHYAEKRMFAPVMISCCEHGEIDQKPHVNTEPKPIEISATLHVANETADPVRGTVIWKLCSPDSTVLRNGAEEITVPAFGGTWLPKTEFSEEVKLIAHLSYAFVVQGKKVSEGTCLFCAPKHYHFADPHLTLTCEGREITVTAHSYAKGVAIESEDGNLALSDNFFDMDKGSVTVRIEGDLPAGKLTVRSVFDIA